jgi:hypothetical protein
MPLVLHRVAKRGRIVLPVSAHTRQRERRAVVVEREEERTRGTRKLGELLADELRRSREVGCLRDDRQKFGNAVAAQRCGGRGRAQVMP